MRKIPSSFIPILIALLILLGFYIGSYTSSGTSYASQRVQKLDYLLKRVDDLHLNPTGIDSLLEIAISDLLHQLDPHSSYLNAQDVQRSRESVSGSFVGIGVEFNVLDDTVWVRGVIPGGPASRAGVRGGDGILRANGESLIGLENAEIMSLLKGVEGSICEVEVIRGNQEELLNINITRGEVPLPSVDIYFRPKERFAFVRITRFSEKTITEVKNAIGYVNAKGAEGFILDLRDNPGGLLNQAVEVASLFLEKGDTILFIEDNRGNSTWHVSKKTGSLKDIPLVILINESSASASEIVAGAIQDNDRGLILGRRSFGKGLVQEEISLPDGSKVRLTTSKYFTPSGRVIQKPYDRGFEAYKNEIYDRMENQDDLPMENTQIFRTRNGRTLFGGGGVRPDILIKRDTSFFSGHAFHLLGSVEALKKINHYGAVHFDSIKNLGPEVLWNSPDTLITFAIFPEARYIPKRDIGEIAVYIKQQVILSVFGRTTMLPYTLREDPYIEKAIQSFSHPETFQNLLKPKSSIQ
jgi:carboxyl-terminal processing protease